MKVNQISNMFIRYSFCCYLCFHGIKNTHIFSTWCNACFIMLYYFLWAIFLTLTKLSNQCPHTYLDQQQAIFWTKRLHISLTHASITNALVSWYWYLRAPIDKLNYNIWAKKRSTAGLFAHGYTGGKMVTRSFMSFSMVGELVELCYISYRYNRVPCFL